MAPRFRPVALRPRLSAGLPKSSNFNMPNKPDRNKRGGVRSPRTERSKSARRADSVKDLLDRLNPTLTRVAIQAGSQDYWRGWLSEQLSHELCQRISGIVEREGTLVIFAESAAWCARLRFCIQEIEQRIRDAPRGIQQVAVRVLPK